MIHILSDIPSPRSELIHRISHKRVISEPKNVTRNHIYMFFDSVGHPLHNIPSSGVYILSVYSQFSDRVGLPLHNIHNPSPFTSIMDIFFVDLKLGHIHFYTL